MNHFFVAALPRSRTAWLANLLTFGNAFCYHEAIRRCSSMDQYFRLLEDPPAEIVGDSSSGLLTNYRQVLERYPQAKWVIVKRDPQEVLNSARKAFPQYQVSAEVIRQGHQALEDLGQHVNGNGLVVDFASMNEMTSDICEFVGVPHNTNRLVQLQELNVQIHLPAALLTGKQPWMPALKPTQQSLLSESYVESLRQMCGANSAAFHWLFECLELAQTWDHLADDDPVDKAMLDRMFLSVLVHWPVNTFFTTNAHMLVPVIYNSILAWKTGQREAAYEVYVNLPLAIALLIGGKELAAKYSPILRAQVVDIMKQDQLEDEICLS